MKNKIIKGLLIIILCAGFGVASYFVTLKMDRMRRGEDVNITVTFEDAETYVIPNTQKLDKEKALEEWPYIVHVENTGSNKGLYQIIISDLEENTMKRDVLEYSLYLDDKEIKTGKLKDIKDNILYTYEINADTKQEYKLYIWANEEANVEKPVYEYKLSFSVIKTGGPGF